MARYIDADKFDTYLRLNHFPSKIMYKGKTIYDYLKEYADKKAEDVKENMRGEWEGDEFGTKCSHCKKYTHLDRFGRPMRFLFCSMCGARMEV